MKNVKLTTILFDLDGTLLPMDKVISIYPQGSFRQLLEYITHQTGGEALFR